MISLCDKGNKKEVVEEEIKRPFFMIIDFSF